MTGNTSLDKFFENNYNNLLAFCVCKSIPEDNLSEVYLKMTKNVIIKSGLTESQYYSYVKKALYNLKLDEAKSLRTRKTVYFNDEDRKRYEIEKSLVEQDLLDADTQKYREELEYFTKMLFKFIENNNYSEIDVYIIKSYFLIDKATYRKLEKDLSININKIKRIIRHFKNDVRTNFITWLNKQN